MIPTLGITFSVNSCSLWVWNFKFPHFPTLGSHTFLLAGNTGPRFMTFLTLPYFLSFDKTSSVEEFSISKLNENLSIIISDISFVYVSILFAKWLSLQYTIFVKYFKEKLHLQQPNQKSYLAQLRLMLHLCCWSIWEEWKMLVGVFSPAECRWRLVIMEHRLTYWKLGLLHQQSAAERALRVVRWEYEKEEGWLHCSLARSTA